MKQVLCEDNYYVIDDSAGEIRILSSHTSRNVAEKFATREQGVCSGSCLRHLLEYEEEDRKKGGEEK